MARHRLEPDEYGSVLVSDLRPLVRSSAGRPVPPTQLRTQRVWEPAVEHAGLEPLRIHDYADPRVMPTSARNPLHDGVSVLAVSA